MLGSLPRCGRVHVGTGWYDRPVAHDLGDILGQTHALEQLHAMLAADRVHHGFVFHGPAGVGKFTTALALAKTLLCHEPSTTLTGQVEACGRCRSCRLFKPPAEDDADDPLRPVSHPDLHVVTKELSRFSDDANVRQRKLTNIPVDVLREHLIGPAFRSAQHAHGKVFIVDEAELMRREGQNALLKTLEEPPDGTFIILVTSSEERLLPTIRSRCQRIAFVPLPEDVVTHYVKQHAPKLDDPARQWVTRFADGSLGRAQLALNRGLTAWADALLPALEQLASGRAVPELGEQAAEQVDKFAEQWVKDHANASKEAANKLGAALLASLLTVEARHRLAQTAQRVPAGDPLAGDAALSPWLGVIEATQAFGQRLGSNVNLKLAAAGLAADLAAALRPTPTPA